MSRFLGWKNFSRGRNSGREDSWHWESLKMARWEGFGMGRFLAVTEQGNLEEGQPRLLATLDTSMVQVMTSPYRGLSPASLASFPEAF